MNNDLYPQVYRTTEAMGNDQTPTPIKVNVIKNGEDYHLKVEGADGQQVSDLIVNAIRQMPSNKPQNGLAEFIGGLIFFSLVLILGVNAIVSNWAKPQPQTQGAAPIYLAEDPRGTGR